MNIYCPHDAACHSRNTTAKLTYDENFAEWTPIMYTWETLWFLTPLQPPASVVVEANFELSLK